MDNGVYFGLPDKDYFAEPRLSASGIKSLLISIGTFWQGSWMNPGDEDEDEDSMAQKVGHAYHAAILDPEEFEKRFMFEPDYSDIPDLLRSDAAVCAVLKELGQPQKPKGETIEERAHRLLDIDPTLQIKSLMDLEFQERSEGFTVLPADLESRMVQTMDMIANTDERVASLVRGGESEVSIFWTCDETGIPMKARIDKLHGDFFLDLKSFSNRNGKPINQCIRDQTQYYQYYLQMRVYQMAIAAISQQHLGFISIDMPDGCTIPHIERENAERKDLIDKIMNTDTPSQPWILFMEKGGTPNILARRLKLQDYPAGVTAQEIGAEDHDIKMSDSALCRKADVEIRHAKKLFATALAAYGPDAPWYPFDMVDDITDDDFSPYFLDSMPT